MKKFALSLTIFLTMVFVANAASSQEKVFFHNLPVPNGVQPSTDPSIPKIAWNRWTTKGGFSVNSIEPSQGEYLFENIDNMKAWCLTRWGLPDIQFSTECRIFCAPDKEMMKKLFNLESSHGEVKIQDGKITISYLWLVLDAKPAEIIPPALTIVCLKELNQKYNCNMSWWIYRGMPLMNATLPQIRAQFAPLGAALQSGFPAKTLFATTEAEWKKMTVQQRRLFDAQAALMCLFIRKEYGQGKFQVFLRFNNYEEHIKNLGFDMAKFDDTYKRFGVNLSNDIQQNKCPDTYLQVEAVKR